MTLAPLTWLVLAPLPTLALVLLLPRRAHGAARWLTLATLAVQALLFALLLWPHCCPTDASGALGTLPISERAPWFELGYGGSSVLRAEWLLGLDSLNLLLVALTLVILPVATLASWRVQASPQAFFALLLLLDVALLGCFLALDLLLFFVFFELMLLPMYFLIGVWGGERRRAAALKFFLYTLVGSVLLLAAILMLAFSYGQVENQVVIHTFDLTAMSTPAALLPGALLSSLDWRLICFWLVLLGFAIKLPAVPVHTWLPDAHVEASTPISVLLAAVLLKVGGYGLLRVGLGVFPEAFLLHGGWIAGLGLLAIIYGALLCLAQQDLKRLVAYSSVSHMGYVLLGLGSLTSAAVLGAMLQLVAHGLNAALLFLIVGVLYERVHDRRIASFEGLWTRMPRLTAVTAVAFFAGMALPGTAPFIAEFLVFVGAFESAQRLGLFHIGLVFVALGGVLLSAGYFIWTLQRMFFGSYRVRGGAAWDAAMHDLTAREALTMVPLALLGILFGVLPHLLIDAVDPGLAQFLSSALARGRSWLP